MQHRGPQLEVPQVCQVCFCMEHEGKLEDKGGRKEVYVRGYGGGGGGIKLGLEPTGNEGRRVKKKKRGWLVERIV